MRESTTLEEIRVFCLALSGVTERLSHGAPTFFVDGKRPFVMYVDNHHNDGRLALWCVAPPGAQSVLVGGMPDRYFIPPYVGCKGWVGVHLNRGTQWEEIAGIIEDGYQERASKQAAKRRG